MMRRGWMAGLLLCVGACAPTAQEQRARDFADDGVFLYQRGAYPQARASFQAALKLRPNDADLVYDVGRCYDRQGQRDKARTAYLACLRRNPDHADCRHALAVLDYESGDKDACRAMIEQWLNDSPRLAAAYAEHAWLLRREGDLSGAHKRAFQALDFDPTDRRALTELAVVHGLRGQPELAVKVDEQALALYPDQPETKAHLTAMRREVDERARRARDEADQKKPGSLP